MANYASVKFSLTGGGEGALDGVNGNSLLDGDAAVVYTDTSIYFYILDVDNAGVASSPDLIAPTTNAGDKRWVLVSSTASSGDGSFKTQGTTTQDPNDTSYPVILTNHANTPDSLKFWHILTTFYLNINTTGNRGQIAIEYNPGTPANGARFFFRSCYNTVWSTWAESVTSTSGTASNSLKLGGALPSVVAGNDTIVKRHASGYIFANFFNSTSGATAVVPTNVWVETGSDSYMRKQTPASFRANVVTPWHLQTVANSYLSAKVIVPENHRDKGIFGTYVQSKTQHIWSMGAAYKNSATGANFGNLYGMAYKYNANGIGHCICFVQNGVQRGSIGTNIWTSGNVTAYSDERVKENIEVIPNALEKVKSVSGYTFDRTDQDCPRQTGVIAQEVLKVLPEAVTTNEEGMHSVAYGNLVGLLIESIKELELSVTTLKNRVNELENK